MLVPIKRASSRQEFQQSKIVRIRLVLFTYIWLTILIVKKAKMAIKTQINALLQEKMDRKDFLKYAGTIALGVVGFTGLFRMLLGSHGLNVSSDSTSRPQGNGYGSSSYGK